MCQFHFSSNFFVLKGTHEPGGHYCLTYCLPFRPKIVLMKNLCPNCSSGKTRPFLFSWNILADYWVSKLCLDSAACFMWAVNHSVHCFGFNCKGQDACVHISWFPSINPSVKLVHVGLEGVICLSEWEKLNLVPQLLFWVKGGVCLNLNRSTCNKCLVPPFFLGLGLKGDWQRLLTSGLNLHSYGVWSNLWKRGNLPAHACIG